MPTPRRSLWGWGTEDAAVGLDETQARIEPFFGGSERETAQPARVPVARVAVPAKLAAFSLADDTTRPAHAMGKAYPERGAGVRGDSPAAPLVVFSPPGSHPLRARTPEAASGARASPERDATIDRQDAPPLDALDLDAPSAADPDAYGLSADAASDTGGLFDAGPDPVDAFILTLDAFEPPDVFSPRDAFLAPDAFSPPDAFVARDARSGGCMSGAAGNRAVRFRWEGSGARSTAYVRYEANELPDTTRWRVTANSRSIGYRPVFDDVFLGEGGLDLNGTGFIDVELSLSGLSSLRSVTLAIYGRSFNTTASGSFEWQTFDGTGAAPSGLVANSAPYEWYAADATTEFTAGDDGVLLRIYPGPPSGSIIVNRVEVCFDAS